MNEEDRIDMLTDETDRSVSGELPPPDEWPEPPPRVDIATDDTDRSVPGLPAELRTETTPQAVRITPSGSNTALLRDSDGVWNAAGVPIAHAGDPVDPQDVATKAYVDSLLVKKNE
jgi:hypothetical protein